MKPLLSVAMIFKNEIRCLKRCMESLQPLRKRFSVEIVMADTGSTDGSRSIAEHYADVLFDFPWVNDFSAARNATLDCCSGAWALVIDCDEWLDSDLDELTDFLLGTQKERFNQVMVIQRNYSTADLSEYGDAKPYRLLNMASRPRFVGTIHEIPTFSKEGLTAEFVRTILHHDGYVMLNNGSGAGEEKRRRNIGLLREELEKTPDDLCRLMQFLESGDLEPDHDEQLRRAVALVEAKAPEWERYGPPLLRYAVQTAYSRELPELDQWMEIAIERFLNSYFTRIDVAYVLTARSFEQRDFRGAVRCGEAYLQARRDFASDNKGRQEMSVSILQRDDDNSEWDVRAIMARSFLRLGQPERALSLLENWAWEETGARQVQNFIIALRELRGSFDVNILPLLMECQERIQKPVPSAERAAERVQAFQELCTIKDSDAPQTPPELMQLAEKVKAILDKLPPNDPMALELKNSEAYKKISHLIEG